MYVIIYCGAQQIISRSDRVEIPREVQVYVLHRNNLGISAARRAAFYPENRTERRLSEGDNRLMPEH
jgi:hypothetical protein